LVVLPAKLKRLIHVNMRSAKSHHAAICKKAIAQLKEAYEKEVRKNRALAQQLNEYRNGVETLREQLSELNLFNAKLLYVNKITQDREVTSSQRRAVVEALDGAKNLREAKLIYKSLSEVTKQGQFRLLERVSPQALAWSSLQAHHIGWSNTTQ